MGTELPLGVVTALVGGPFFLVLLRTGTITAETLSRGYQRPIDVVEHPIRGGPLALPAG